MLIKLGTLVLVLWIALLAPGVAGAAATWLDSPPSGTWNTPGGQIPQAPPIHNPDPRCRTSEVAPTTPEGMQLAARGWRLESFWPPISSGGLVVQAALAEYDGMCRPFEYNVFVFSQGTYAGTLSPDNMNSRLDGSLFVGPGQQVAVIGPSGSIAANFIRYADTDPLCCPSRGVSHVVYSVQTQNGQPVVVPDSITTLSASPAQVPSALPATGSLPELGWLALGLGAVLALAGYEIRRASRRHSRGL
jgi:hypothetical protein